LQGTSFLAYFSRGLKTFYNIENLGELEDRPGGVIHPDELPVGDGVVVVADVLGPGVNVLEAKKVFCQCKMKHVGIFRLKTV
jgi:hypothetical protein